MYAMNDYRGKMYAKKSVRWFINYVIKILIPVQNTFGSATATYCGLFAEYLEGTVCPPLTMILSKVWPAPDNIPRAVQIYIGQHTDKATESKNIRAHESHDKWCADKHLAADQHHKTTGLYLRRTLYILTLEEEV